MGYAYLSVCIALNTWSIYLPWRWNGGIRCYALVIFILLFIHQVRSRWLLALLLWNSCLSGTRSSSCRRVRLSWTASVASSQSRWWCVASLWRSKQRVDVSSLLGCWHSQWQSRCRLASAFGSWRVSAGFWVAARVLLSRLYGGPSLRWIMSNCSMGHTA